MLMQLESQPEYGGDNGSGGCGDDEPGDDEDGGEDENMLSRLKRIYMCEKPEKEMRWHDEGRTQDGKLRDPADALAWIDARYTDLAFDPCSVRLSIASV
nr:hypothetical protein [Tanacetum cinerariifolium]